MPSNKKHHFVPRFYLRRFSADGVSINLYNVPSGRSIFRANRKNQAYRDCFYGKELEVEHAIAGLDRGRAAQDRRIPVPSAALRAGSRRPGHPSGDATGANGV